MAISKDEWRLYSGGQMLGGNDMDALLSKEYEAEKTSRTDKWGNAADLTRGEWDTYNRYIGEAEANGWETAGLNQKYGVSMRPNTPVISNFAGANKLYGYNSAGSGTVKQHYTNKYGTAKGFSEGDELNSALDRVYGQVQGANAMGQGWLSLYHTYNKWEQEDEMFQAEMLGLQNELFPAAEARQRASMAAGGMETGSAQWKSSLQGIANKRMDVDAEVAERKSALEDTSIYKALHNQYEEMRGLGEMRGIQQTETRYRDVSSWVDETSKYTSPRYGHDSETGTQYEISPGYWTDVPGHYNITSQAYQHNYVQGTETGRLLYGTGEGKLTGPSFNEFYQSQFGKASGVDNPYAGAGSVSNQPLSDEDRRARMAAGGADMGAT